MDFRTCPLCKASVLDDEAEECPSCGASLNGKPSAAKPAPAKPAASKPAASKAPPGKPGPAKPDVAEKTGSSPAARPATPGGRPGARPGAHLRGDAPAEDDNPFDIDVAALQKVPKVSPRPVKGSTIEVACPMCETKGFIAPTLQGKDVRCANADCKVPIFKAPLPKREVVDPNAGKAKGLSTGMLAGIGVVAAGAIGAGLFFLMRQPPVVDQPGQLSPAQANGGKDTGLEGLMPDSNEIILPARATLSSLAEIQAEGLKDLTKNASFRDNSNRALPRMWAAEALAMVGQIEPARDQLKALMSVAGSSPFYKIQPLVQIALNRRTAAAADAEAALKEALAAAASLPSSSRRPLDAVSDLASVLVVMDRAAEAQTLLAKPALGSRASRSLLWSAATMGRTYRFDVVESIPAWTGSSHPQWAAVTWIVVARKAPDKALAWAKSAPTAELRDSCLGVWAAKVGLDAPNTSAARQQLEAALNGESPAARAQAWANFAFVRQLAGDAAGAKSALANADAAIGEIAAASPMKPPEMAAIHDAEGRPRAGLPDPSPLRSAALAAASVARAHQALNDPAGTVNFLRSALAFSAGAAPSRTDTQRLLDECENNRTGVQDRLDQMLSLKGNNDRRFRAFNQYRQQCNQLNSEAQARFDLEVAILQNAAGHGSTAPAWELLKGGQQASDTSLRQPYFQTNLPGYIAFRAYSTDQPTYKDIEAAFPPKSVPFDRIDEVTFQVEDGLKAGRTQQVYNLLKQIQQERTFDHDRLDNELLRVFSLRNREIKSVKSFDFIWQMSGDALRGDALWLLGAESIARGEATDLWTAYAEQRRLPPTDRTAITRGFIDGILAAPAADKKLADAVSKP